jgi:adenylate kinase family enzyme
MQRVLILGSGGAGKTTLARKLAEVLGIEVIHPDFPRTVCLWRIQKRVVQYHGRTRPDLPEGCPERLDFEFVAWAWNFPTRSRHKVLLEPRRHTKKVVRLRSRKEVDEFFAQQLTV